MYSTKAVTTHQIRISVPRLVYHIIWLSPLQVIMWTDQLNVLVKCLAACTMWILPLSEYICKLYWLRNIQLLMQNLKYVPIYLFSFLKINKIQNNSLAAVVFGNIRALLVVLLHRNVHPIFSTYGRNIRWTSYMPKKTKMDHLEYYQGSYTQDPSHYLKKLSTNREMHQETGCNMSASEAPD